MTQNEAEKNQTLNSLILKNQFNHRGMIRKPKTEGKTIVLSIKLVSKCFERSSRMVSYY
jgi:hypothetical protein